MTLSLMIKRKYLAEKLAEQEETGTFHERREYKSFWRNRIGATNAWKNNGGAVFLCGRYAFMADILNITIDETPPGIEDVVDTLIMLTQTQRSISQFVKALINP